MGDELTKRTVVPKEHGHLNKNENSPWVEEASFFSTFKYFLQSVHKICILRVAFSSLTKNTECLLIVINFHAAFKQKVHITGGTKKHKDPTEAVSISFKGFDKVSSEASFVKITLRNIPMIINKKSVTGHN